MATGQMNNDWTQSVLMHISHFPKTNFRKVIDDNDNSIQNEKCWKLFQESIVFSFPIWHFVSISYNPFIKRLINIYFQWEWLIFRSLTFNANCLKRNHLQINTSELSQTLIPGLKRMNTNNKTNGESRESDKSINVGWKVEYIVWRTNGLWTVEELLFFVRLLFIHSLSLSFFYFRFLSTSFCVFEHNERSNWVDSTIDNATAWNLNRTRTHFVDAHIVRITWEPIVCLFDYRFLCLLLRVFQLTGFFAPLCNKKFLE